MDVVIIGVDVGGTNTDIVLLQNSDIIGHIKMKTTVDISDGIISGINQLLTNTQTPHESVQFVNLSTTHMLNALLQGHVSPVAILRIGAPATTALPPQCDWDNERLTQKINGYATILSGGYFYDGNESTSLNQDEITKAVRNIKERDLKQIAVTGVFSQVAPQQEITLAELLSQQLPHCHITLSHDKDGGLLERENMTMVIAALHDIFNKTFKNVTTNLNHIGLAHANIFISHNDGTLATLNQANPFLTLKAGPTNSLRGAGKLMPHLKHALAVDIGGTTTDAGIIINGEPIEKNALFNIAGINFKSPTSHVEAIALGGGTQITLTNDGIGLGESVANKLLTASKSFGGSTLTVTDIALAYKRIDIPNHNTCWTTELSADQLAAIDTTIHQRLASLIDNVASSVSDKPQDVILIGGGAALFDTTKLYELLHHKLPSLRIHVPKHAAIANAIGAAFAEISGTHTGIYDLSIHSRNEACELTKQIAHDNACYNGASKNSLRLKNITLTEVNYLPGNHTKIQVKVAGAPKIKQTDSKKSTYHKITIDTLSISNPTKSELNPTSRPLPQRLSNHDQKFNCCPTVALQIASRLSQIEALSKEAIHHRAIGFDFLGSGGGGSTRLSKLMVTACLQRQKFIKELPLDDLPNDANVICSGFIGSPMIFEENPPSIDSLINSVLKMEAISGKRVHALMPMEGGGANGLVPYVVAAELNIPIVNADAMGRAFPGINMITPAIYDGIDHYTATLTSTLETKVIHAHSANELEQKAREVTQQLGAMSFLSFYPLTGQAVKKLCINNTPKLAEAIGQQFMLARMQGINPLIPLNEFLKQTDYGAITELFSGRISEIKRSEVCGFSLGGINVLNGKKRYHIIFQNENIIARQITTNHRSQPLACVPDLITVVDYDTFEPIGSTDYTFGRKIRVLTIGAPAILKTQRALKVVGPDSPTYQVKEALRVFEGQ